MARVLMASTSRNNLLAIGLGEADGTLDVLLIVRKSDEKRLRSDGRLRSVLVKTRPTNSGMTLPLARRRLAA